MSFDLEIVTPERTVYSGIVQSVRAPGSEGGFGVLTGHQPLLAGLGIGQVSFVEASGERVSMAISGGFSEVQRDRMTILAETAEMGNEIDIARAEASRDRARDRLSGRRDPDVDVTRSEAALDRALWRLKIVRGI